LNTRRAKEGRGKKSSRSRRALVGRRRGAHPESGRFVGKGERGWIAASSQRRKRRKSSVIVGSGRRKRNALLLRGGISGGEEVVSMSTMKGKEKEEILSSGGGESCRRCWRFLCSILRNRKEKGREGDVFPIPGRRREKEEESTSCPTPFRRGKEVILLLTEKRNRNHLFSAGGGEEEKAFSRITQLSLFRVMGVAGIERETTSPPPSPPPPPGGRKKKKRVSPLTGETVRRLTAGRRKGLVPCLGVFSCLTHFEEGKRKRKKKNRKKR